MQSLPLGIIFDWDGVVVDSAAQHRLSWERLAAEENLPLSVGHFERSFGRKNAYIIPEILNWSSDSTVIDRLSDRKEMLYREAVKESGLNPLPGVKRLLEELKAAGVPCAIGSSTSRENLTFALRLLGLNNAFDKIVSAEDVSVGKPDPAVFLKAAEALALPPEACVVIEDAPVGIEAALAGGISVVGVATTHPISNLFLANRVVTTLEDLFLDDLQMLVRSAALRRPLQNG